MTDTKLPASAYHAVRYADWTDSALCSIGARHHAPTLTPAQRRRALASFSLPTVAHYSIVDCMQEGAALYYAPAPTPAPWSPFGAMVLDSVRRLRRWRYYDASDAAPALPAQPLDGCACRVCLSRA